MTSENFVYWLQGFLEIGNPETISKEQIQEIKNHIALVLRKITVTAQIKPQDRLDIYKWGSWMKKDLETGKVESLNSIPLMEGWNYNSKEGGYYHPNDSTVVYIQPIASC